MSDTIDCPKCGHEHNPYYESTEFDEVCESCGFEFSVFVDVKPIFDTKCKECSLGEWYSKDEFAGYIFRECSICGYIVAKEKDGDSVESKELQDQ